MAIFNIHCNGYSGFNTGTIKRVWQTKQFRQMIKTIDYKRKRKLKRVMMAYLKHKGIEAEEYSFSLKVFKKPAFRVAGFNIAFEVIEYRGKQVCFFSLISRVCSTTQKIN